MTETRTILVVDDDPELRQGLKIVLDRYGYRTLEADDGHKAQQIIDAHRPDLVILDMMMPRWGGLAVLEHFRGKRGAPPFIMLTANESDGHKHHARQLGVLDYIRKPFSMDRLLERVARAVPAPNTAKQPAAEAPVPDASIRCRCPGCGSRIKAPMQLLGQTRTCPRCSRSFVVAVQPPEAEGPMLVMDGVLAPSPHASGPRQWRR
jgi:CheY-like chemotaxis protein